jgi:hypothetical protein
MALIIEDGTGLSDSQSYAAAADLRAYAALRGVTVPSDDGACEVLLIAAMDYLKQYDDLPNGMRFWIGAGKLLPDQALAWPRTCVTKDGEAKPSNYMPQELANGQCALAIEAVKADIQPTRLPTDQGQVVSESVGGAVSVTYANWGRTLTTAAFAKADAQLRPIMYRAGLTSIVATRY